LDIIDPIPAFIIFALLIVIVIGLTVVGCAVAYQLTAAIGSVPVGAALGFSVAVLIARDFLRWRLSWTAVVAVASFAFIFMVAFW